MIFIIKKLRINVIDRIDYNSYIKRQLTIATFNYCFCPNSDIVSFHFESIISHVTQVTKDVMFMIYIVSIVYVTQKSDDRSLYSISNL